MAPLTPMFSNARHLASRPVCLSIHQPAHPPGRPAALLLIRTPPSSMGRTTLLLPLPVCV